ncbi:hypothetical protein BESB_030180 [Besnoitia besnoiti]|uniref:Transmembrane protein n=1 Tax=Besnoitia besnoiti TaxID=94643 RepID=A0A2A9M1M5_BESBE|nr:hypothetical protein BESB_030180 [Besnoitia besnoiti]PFH31144.1 hypothetical protein BESB_030180 [Besnoitia besnoiti]
MMRPPVSRGSCEPSQAHHLTRIPQPLFFLFLVALLLSTHPLTPAAAFRSSPIASAAIDAHIELPDGQAIDIQHATASAPPVAALDDTLPSSRETAERVSPSSSSRSSSGMHLPLAEMPSVEVDAENVDAALAGAQAAGVETLGVEAVSAETVDSSLNHSFAAPEGGSGGSQAAKTGSASQIEAADASPSSLTPATAEALGAAGASDSSFSASQRAPVDGGESPAGTSGNARAQSFRRAHVGRDSAADTSGVPGETMETAEAAAADANSAEEGIQEDSVSAESPPLAPAFGQQEARDGILADAAATGREEDARREGKAAGEAANGEPDLSASVEDDTRPFSLLFLAIVADLVAMALLLTSIPVVLSVRLAKDYSQFAVRGTPTRASQQTDRNPDAQCSIPEPAASGVRQAQPQSRGKPRSALNCRNGGEGRWTPVSSARRVCPQARGRGWKFWKAEEMTSFEAPTYADGGIASFDEFSPAPSGAGSGDRARSHYYRYS